MPEKAVNSYVFRLVPGVLLLAGLYLTSRYNYLLFHSLAEFFSIAIAYAAFMLAWNSRGFMTNRFFLFIGIAYLFIGSLDMLHTLSYKGMHIFEGYGANLPTQLWIAARYMESASFLAGILLIGRDLRAKRVLAAYAALMLLLLMSIFYWGMFPACYIEGSGLTPFKKISEYVISGFLACSMALLYRKRSAFDKTVLRLLSGSILLTIGSELSFTLYVDVYGLFNLIGHYLKILSFYLIYMALIEAGLKKPYSLLFRELKWHEDRITSERDLAREYLDIAGVIIVVLDRDRKVIQINRKGCEVLGYEEEEVKGRDWLDSFLPERLRKDVKKVYDNLIAGEIAPVEYYENPVLTRDGKERLIAWHNTVLRDMQGNIQYTLASGEDITERRQAEEEAGRSKEILEKTIDGMEEVVLIVDSSSRTIDKCNRALERIWGYAPEEIQGRNTEFMHTSRENYERFGHEMSSSLRREGVFHTEYEYRRKDGSTFSAEVSVTMVLEGSERGPKLVGVFRDITERKRAEQKLMETTLQYRELVESTEAIHWELDLGTMRFTYVSPQAEKILGYPVRQWEDYYFWASILHPDDRDWAMEYCEQCTSRSEDHEFTYRILDREGREVWIRDIVKVISDESGPKKLLGVMFDVTEQKYRENALKRANDINRAILDNMLESICIINTGDFTIQAANKAFLEEYGLTEEEALGRTCHKVTHRLSSPCSAPEDLCPLHEALELGSHAMAEHTHYRADGRELMVEVWAVPIKDSAGDISQAVHISRDITERKRAEEAIKGHSRFLQTLIETIPNPVFYKDAEERYLGCNKAFEKFIHLSKKEIIGRSVYDIAPRELAHKYHEMDAELLNNPGVQVYEAAVMDNEGQRHDVIFNKATYNKADGSMGGLVGVVVDITERKQLEASLRQAADEKEMLMREMSHRVKNNLNVIQSLLNLQSSEIEDAGVRGKLDDSRSRVKAMSMIHERLYKSSDLSSIDFSEYITDLAKQLYENYCIDKHAISLKVDIPKVSFDVDTMVPCALIVNELVTNALKYAFPDGREGEISVTAEYDEAGQGFIMVSDNGVGLPEGLDILKTDTLGMKIVKALSMQVGSDVQIRSNENGTEFKMLLLRATLKPLEWNDRSHLIGHELIDRQHRQLYDAIENLRAAIESGRHDEGVSDIIPPLLEYVDEHFRTEEEIMVEHEYPSYDAHRKAHDEFKEKVQNAIAEIRAGKRGLSLSVYEFLTDWLLEHILKYDKELPVFMKEKGMINAGLKAEQQKGQYQILVIEDDRIAQAIMTRFLQKLGYSFLLASKGKEAVTLSGNNTFELIISDVILPDINGIETVKLLRESGIDTPVIYLTGKEESHVSEQTKGLEVVKILPKPVQFPELERTLSGFFRK